MSLVSCKELYHYKDDDVYPNRVIIAVLWIEQQQLLYFVFSFFFISFLILRITVLASRLPCACKSGPALRKHSTNVGKSEHP